ncbi:hypothetical protein BC831DRAFT_458671 [Entophlyctis helioformis]|nr:hypothetical protein BC831DRAFT_458671 [Entophlyctis helioformis]
MAGGILSFSEPLVWAILLCTDFSLIAFVRSSLTGNCSFVDRFWSITPILYAWIFAIFARVNSGSFDFRCTVGAVLVTAWGVRLTWNFARKGGYRPGEEDYRWPYLREHIITNKALYALFNFVFISFYQNFLLLAIVMPLWAAYLNAVSATPNTAITAIDVVAVCLFVLLLAGETIADNQQFNFQTAKYAMLGETDPHTGVKRKLADLPAPFKYGFSNEGLFSISRHPNFFCEFMQWWALYLLSVAAAPGTPAAITAGSVSWINWTVPGTVLLTLLFLGSTAFTEYISAQKYPLYAVYKTTTSMLVPWIPGPRDLEAVAAAAQA